MKSIVISSYGKINLSIDVLEKLPSGYHRVEMVMQQIALHDDVSVKWIPGTKNPQSVEVSTNRPYLPVDQRNLATQAANLMWERYGQGREGTLRIDIKKRLPVAAGLAEEAATAQRYSRREPYLWNLRLSIEALC